MTVEKPNFLSTIVEVLCSLALSDHMGDVRDAEDKLWKLIGVEELPYDDAVWNSGSAFRIAKARLGYAGIPLPDYLRDDND